MSNNFMAVTKKCEKCGEKYMPNHQSADCPHLRLIDLMSKEQDRLLTVITKIIDNIVEDGCHHSAGEIITEDCTLWDCHECCASEIIAKTASLVRKEIGELTKHYNELIKILEDEQEANTTAAIGLVVSHIWQFAEGTGYPLMWRVSDADKRAVLKHYGVHYQGDNCPTCGGKCKAK